MPQAPDKILSPVAIVLRLAYAVHVSSGKLSRPQAAFAEVIDRLEQDPPDIRGALTAASDGAQCGHFVDAWDAPPDVVWCAAIVEILRPALTREHASPVLASID